jgi:hypothetical protein
MTNKNSAHWQQSREMRHCGLRSKQVRSQHSLLEKMCACFPGPESRCLPRYARHIQVNCSCICFMCIYLETEFHCIAQAVLTMSHILPPCQAQSVASEPGVLLFFFFLPLPFFLFTEFHCSPGCSSIFRVKGDFPLTKSFLSQLCQLKLLQDKQMELHTTSKWDFLFPTFSELAIVEYTLSLSHVPVHLSKPI